jgi:hypothetical protein
MLTVAVKPEATFALEEAGDPQQVTSIHALKCAERV